MLYFFFGTDREGARAAMKKRLPERVRVVYITDANSPEDLSAALAGRGLFGEARSVVLDGVFANEDMRRIVLGVLAQLKEAEEPIFVLEEKLDADTRKKIETYAETSERFDAKKAKRDGNIFAAAYALQRGDRKTLWVEYQRALARGDAPEAIHGILFWGAKDAYLKSSGVARERAGRLVAELAQLPHEARRRGVELEYALECYLLAVNKA